jgi:hypothetical protein
MAQRCIRLEVPESGVVMVTNASYRPLQPMNLQGLYTEALRLYQNNFWSLVAIVAIFQVLVAVVRALTGVVYGGGAFAVSGILSLIGFVVIILATFLQAGALTLAVADDYLGQPISVERAYEGAGQRFMALLGTSLLVSVLILLMCVTIIGIPFAIFFGVRWAFSTQCVMLEGVSGTQAMALSARRVIGSWWRTFGILLLTVIIVGLVSGIVTAIFGVFHVRLLTFLVSLVMGILTAPFETAVLTLLYFDMRVRKDGLTHDDLLTARGQVTATA